MGSEFKRANTRYMVRLQTELSYDGQTISAWIVDLSLGGALIEATFDPPMRVGASLEISFVLPDLEEPLTAKAAVRVAEPHAIGIQFMTGFRAKQTWALGRYLKRQSPA